MTRTAGRTRNEAIIGGIVLVVVGGMFAAGARSFGVGGLTDMGPGFFPMATGVGLAAMGVFEVVRALSLTIEDGTGLPMGPARLNLWAIGCVLGGLFAFALLIERAGLLPAIFVSTLLALAGERPIRWGRSLIYATVMTWAAWVVFILGLGLPVSLFGW